MPNTAGIEYTLRRFEMGPRRPICTSGFMSRLFVSPRTRDRESFPRLEIVTGSRYR